MALNDDGESFSLPPPSPRRARVGDVHRPRLITELPREVVPHVTQFLTLPEAQMLRSTSRNDMGIPTYTTQGGALTQKATQAEMEHILHGIKRPTVGGRLVSGPQRELVSSVRGIEAQFGRLSRKQRRVIPIAPAAEKALVGRRPRPLKDQHPDLHPLLRRIGYIP